MKKSLLFLATLALAASSMSAAVTKDAASYEAKEGLTCENLWLYSRFTNTWSESPESLPMVADQDRARTATILGDKIYVGYSHKLLVGEELNSGSAHYIVYDLATGKYEGTVQCTENGQTIDGLLIANQIGTDDFGHLWFIGYNNSGFWQVDADGNVGTQRAPMGVYLVKDLATGECEKQFSITLPEDEANASARVDYYDLVGDVTRAESHCVVIAASCEGASAPYVYGWKVEQGQDETIPHMTDGEYYAQPVEETYPAEQTCFNYGSVAYISRDEEHSGDLFYIDGFTTYPSLYNTSGAMIDGFANVTDEITKSMSTGANGICEFRIGDVDYVAYVLNQYNKDPECAIGIGKLGDGQAFEPLKHLWTLPEAGMGDVSDGGLRVHSIKTQTYTDENGKQGVYLMSYKANNGLAAYRIAEEGFIDPNGGVEGILADNNNAPVEYFNLQGVRVNANNLTPGIYVTRQGNKASKVAVK